MLLSSLDTAINTIIIPHAGPSTADNFSVEEFHLGWSPQGSQKILLDGSQFYLGKGGCWTTGGVRQSEAKLKLTHNF